MQSNDKDLEKAIELFEKLLNTLPSNISGFVVLSESDASSWQAVSTKINNISNICPILGEVCYVIVERIKELNNTDFSFILEYLNNISLNLELERRKRSGEIIKRKLT